MNTRISAIEHLRTLRGGAQSHLLRASDGNWPGLVAIVPAGVRHSVKALSDGRAIIVDYPLRPDFHWRYQMANGHAHI